MKDEIKEILDIIKKVSKAKVNSYNGLIETPPIKWEMFLDYITNLQEEVKFTEDYKDAYETTMIANKMLEEKYTDYKSRCEKAIELLKQAGSYDEETKQFCDDVWEELPEILSVLEGSDK